MSNNDLSLIEKFKSLMQQAMLYAQYSHDYIFIITQFFVLSTIIFRLRKFFSCIFAIFIILYAYKHYMKGGVDI